MLIALTALAFLYLNSGSLFNPLKCIISSVDSKTYCVRDFDNTKEAADLLARTCNRLKLFVDDLYTNNQQDARVVKLRQNFRADSISEILPTSKHTAYSENKGERLAFCLRKDREQKQLIDENTLMFVALHELAHIMTTSVGHTREFWGNFKYLLHHAQRAGLYASVDYSQEPVQYCGMTIADNPLHS